MWNIWDRDTDRLMLGCSVNTKEEAEHYLINHYGKKYGWEKGKQYPNKKGYYKAVKGRMFVIETKQKWTLID